MLLKRAVEFCHLFHFTFIYCNFFLLRYIISALLTIIHESECVLSRVLQGSIILQLNCSGVSIKSQGALQRPVDYISLTMIKIILLAVLLVFSVSAQRGGGRGGRGKPKCADGSKPTCSDGSQPVFDGDK